jgi:hypothetical protein
LLKNRGGGMSLTVNNANGYPPLGIQRLILITEEYEKRI